MTERKKPAPFSCPVCERRWDGADQAHCRAGCCRHFGSVRAFDLHRQGPVDDRRCADPAEIVWGDDSKQAGKPRLKGVDGPHGVTWVLAVDRIHPARLAGARDAGTGVPAPTPDRQEAGSR